MEMEIKIQEVKELIANILEVGLDEILMETDFITDLNADSLMALEILATLEKKYKIKISEDSLAKMTNLSNIINVLQNVTGLKVV